MSKKVMIVVMGIMASVIIAMGIVIGYYKNELDFYKYSVEILKDDVTRRQNAWNSDIVYYNEKIQNLKEQISVLEGEAQ